MIGLTPRMLTAAEWLDLDGIAKAAWLAQLDNPGVRAQASALSAANGRSVRQVLNAWVALGYLPAARLPLVLAVAS